jgi:hypothetical protein
MTTITDLPPVRDNVLSDYQQRRLPVFPDREGYPWLLTDMDTTALHMPARLGQRVQEDMRRRMIAGPVMARAEVMGGQDRWTVFCWEDRLPKHEAAAELDRAGVSVCAPGSPLLLPAGYGREPGAPWWIQPPGAELPRMSALVAVTRMMAGGWSPW